MKLTLGDIKTNIARQLSMSGTDSRVVDYINEAQQRLMYKGGWPGTFAKFAVTNTNGMITWPRQLETIESVAVNDAPGIIRNEWYEFLESGPGLLDSKDADAMTLLDRGEAPTFSDLSGTDKKLRLYVTATLDAGKSVLVQGYNEDGDWIRTLDSATNTYYDGEKLTLTSSYVDSTNFFTEVSAVQKPLTEGSLKLYELNTADSTQRVVAEYQPTEQRPTYRRSLIPGLPDSSTHTVTVTGRLRFIPARVDTDWLHISYEAAIKEMVASIRKAENNLPKEALIYEKRAVGLMQDQLLHHLGDGAVAVPRFQNSATAGGGGVMNLI